MVEVGAADTAVGFTTAATSGESLVVLGLVSAASSGRGRTCPGRGPGP